MVWKHAWFYCEHCGKGYYLAVKKRDSLKPFKCVRCGQLIERLNTFEEDLKRFRKDFPRRWNFKDESDRYFRKVERESKGIKYKRYDDYVPKTNPR